MARVFSSFMFVALVFYVAMAADHSPLQDFCVADTNSAVLVNGFACKNPSLVQANDFYFSGLHLMANTSNELGIGATRVFVNEIPGLNTLGISLARVDFAPLGVIPPHTHSRATELLTVLEGSLKVGFVTSNPENRHISKVLHKGDVFVFPASLVHYHSNIGSTKAIVIAALSSQNAGLAPITNVIFGSKPDIATDILAKTFQTDYDVISSIQSNF